MRGENKMENKKKKRFNIIDLIIILVVLALGVGIALRYDFVGKIKSSTEDNTVIVSFLIRGADEEMVSAFNEGDVFYVSSNGMKLGELVKVSSSPAEKLVSNSEGVYVSTTMPGKIDIRGEIRALGTMNSDGFKLGGTFFMAANKNIELKSKNVNMEFTLTGIRLENG